MSESIAIIGDGGMGTACTIILAENGHRVRLWSAFPEAARQLAQTHLNERFLPGAALPPEVAVTGDDEEAFADVSLVVSAVPTQYMRSVWTRLRPHCPKGLAVCSVSKGIENGVLLRPTQIIRDAVGDETLSLAALSGPTIAPELARKLPATATVATHRADLAERFQAAFTRPYFRIYTNDDLIGVELAGATKNVIAIAAGILDGLGSGCNAKAALLTRGLVEITRLGEAMGARAETFNGLSGIGDLVTTCISPVGRNRSFGEAIGGGMSVEEALASTESVVEGMPTTASVVELARREGVEMPITLAIRDVLFEGRSPAEAISDLMTRPLKSEG